MSEILIWVLVLSFLAFGIISYLCKVSRLLLRLLEAAILLAVIGCVIHFFMSKERVSALKKVEKQVIKRINNMGNDMSNKKTLLPTAKVDNSSTAPEPKKEIVKSPVPPAAAEKVPEKTLEKNAETHPVKTSGKKVKNSPSQPSRPAQPEKVAGSVENKNKAQPVPPEKEKAAEPVSPEKKPIKKKQTLLFDEIENMSFDI